MKPRPADYEFISSAGGGSHDSPGFGRTGRRAMAAAGLYGCEAYLQEPEKFSLDSQQGVTRLNITVVRRSQWGGFNLHRGFVRLPDEDLAIAVARIVCEAAGALPER